MKIKHSVDKRLLNMRLIDMRCKHALQTSDKGREVIRLSNLIGYEIAEWGSCSNHDIKYQVDVILKMEEDRYNHPERIVICNYDFYDKPCIWIDNLHSAIRYVRKYGLNVRLEEIPFYVVDILGAEPIVSENGLGILNLDMERIDGAIMCARKRKERSNSKELIKLNYTLHEFLLDNPILLTCRDYFGTEAVTRGSKVI